MAFRRPPVRARLAPYLARPPFGRPFPLRGQGAQTQRGPAAERDRASKATLPFRGYYFVTSTCLSVTLVAVGARCAFGQFLLG